MKRYLLFCLISITNIPISFSQSVIDSASFTPINGETFVLSNCIYNNLLTTIDTGANIIWDFTGLITNSTDSVTYVKPDSSGYVLNNCYQYTCFDIQSPWGSNRSIPGKANNNYRTQMLKYSFDGLIEKGYCEGIGRMQCSYIQKFPFPLTYPDSTASVNYGNGFNMNPISYNWTDSTIYSLKVSGYGSLLLPNGAYNNALLVYVERQRIETEFFFCPNGCVYTDTIFYWLIPGIHHPVLQVNYPSFLGINNAAYVSQIISSIPNTPIQSNIEIFPNPFHLYTNLKYEANNEDSILRIYNLFGQKVKIIKLSSRNTIINRDDLSNGIYFYELDNGKGTIVTGKLVII